MFLQVYNQQEKTLLSHFRAEQCDIMSQHISFHVTNIFQQINRVICFEKMKWKFFGKQFLLCFIQQRGKEELWAQSLTVISPVLEVALSTWICWGYTVTVYEHINLC